MGKKKSGRTGKQQAGAGAGDEAVVGTAFLLRVPMHCRCHGCTDKIRAGVRDLTLNHSYGIQALDQSELGTKGELKVFATGDPHKLRRRLHRSTGKTVDLVLLGSNTPKQQADNKAAAAAAENELMQALLLRAGLQQQQPPPAAAQYAHQVLPGYAAAPQQAAAYNPWALEMLLQQQQQAEAYPAAAAAAAYQYQFHHHHGAAYPGGAAAYPSFPQQGLGAYGGLGGVWPGY